MSTRSIPPERRDPASDSDSAAAAPAELDDSSFVILAGDGEAEAAELALRAVGQPSRRLHRSDDVVRAIGDCSIKALIVAAEALDDFHIPSFRSAVERQSAWSDLPILLLVDRQNAELYSSLLDDLGQVRLVERPMDPFILRRAALAAVRSRTRQAGARALFRQLEVAQRDHLKLSETLEARVSDRTEQLETAYNQLVREVEERCSAEERLRESEELYRYTVELSQQIAWTAGADQRLLSVSPAFYVVTGIQPQVDAQEAWHSAIHPEDHGSVMASWNAAGPIDQPRVAEFRMRMADASYRLVRARAAPRLDDAGRVIGWYGYTEDIHDKRQAELARGEVEERLRESEELYRHTLELSQQIVWTAAPDGTHYGRSPRYNELTGLPSNTPPDRAIHPDDLPAMTTAWNRSIATGELFHCDFRLRMRDGSYRLFRARAAPRRDADGAIVRWYGTSEDIDEQKQAEQARREAEDRYQLALRATNDVIWDLNLLTDQIHWSESAASLFGYGDGGASTPLESWEERVHPDDRDRVANSLKRAIRGKQTHWSASYRFLKADGGYADIYDRGFIIRDADGKGMRAVGAMSDISDRVHAEAQLQRMQAELIHVSRVSAMGTMASTLAHELNQPLTAVTSYVSGSRRLLQHIDDPTVGRVRDALEAAEAGALRAGRIVRGLRELVARGTVNIRPEGLRALIYDASVLAFVDEHLLGVSHRIEVDPSAEWVDADRIQIQQVLINLIRNSVQAMTERPVREVVISGKAASRDMIEICVSDTGVGLTDEVREALFSPFRSTKSDGMGIGLSISRTIVEAHGGKIWAENRESGGATFRFTVPKSEQPAGEAAVPIAAAAE